MQGRQLHPRAWVALLLSALFASTQALCSIFVSVYLWVNSLDFDVICRHHLALYAVTPVVFILAGWYSAAHDRVHAYRMGLMLHAVFYVTLLVLRERSADYAGWLGALLGLAWGVFYAAENTFNFDVTAEGAREYYWGLLMSLTGVARLLAPLAGGLIIHVAPVPQVGYDRVFAIVIVVYLACFVLSFLMPPDNVRRPFHIRRALFPGRDQREWRLIMLASISLAGSFNIFAFLLGILMFMETGTEMSVGSFASFQGLTGVVVSYMMGRIIVPRSRRTFMRWGVAFLVVGGAIIAYKLTIVTLIIFGFMRSVSGPMFGIPHAGMRMDTIAKSAPDLVHRIEYLCAWEVPLALGRIIMMSTMMVLYSTLSESDLGLRITLFILCAIRIVTYAILSKTDALRNAA
ncbi:MAG TPA: hypothetical protein PK468_02065 [Candidatus Hydrogenedentes bacterium]|nr:hypothetical protein [Candidatus Hydrogenedentota bacterium]